MRPEAEHKRAGYFDACGEAYREGEAPPRRASSMLERFGRRIFWTLVIAIVLARAFYFSGFSHF